MESETKSKDWTMRFKEEAERSSSYHHLLADYDIRPLQIKKHIIEVHHVIPHLPRKGYERECWHGQHESAHRE